MRNRALLPLLLPLFFSIPAFSQLFEGKTRSPAVLGDLLAQVTPGTIVLLGENHGLAAHRDQHLQVLNGLRTRGLKVSVGLEFVNYTDQASVDAYRAGSLNEPEFLAAIKWGGISYEFYRPQLVFPDLSLGEYSLGLNIPREVVSKVSKSGLAGLAPEDWALMPPGFALGRDSYKARFMEVAGAHCPNPENCFLAQCTWDDTMAWRASEFIKAHPDQVLVVVVGEFHVQYGGGIPYRIRQRLADARIVTLSQIWADGLSDEEVQQEMQPSPLEGPRADFIWVSRP